MNSSDVDIIVGTNKERDPDVRKLKVEAIRHFQYNDVTIENDLALLKLTEKLTFNSSVRPICISNRKILEVYDVCVVTGWGRTDPG
ncbi:hypothetical protein HELRODRAFT_85581 [Helobdella robusta]|uniref:Peptidase S1 domain-containing protein n=1 Tax=Helobdella robusta TaxID=6412 RepID=T1G600_HELRO|nr:hypothetical protein HELRODRAFT_85581 [Helobdella robusta]ESN97233.1 hypothetical protein HELRODRAFT_85581 [Helobdella robusta]